jgi:hypothetical protein
VVVLVRDRSTRLLDKLAALREVAGDRILRSPAGESRLVKSNRRVELGARAPR